MRALVVKDGRVAVEERPDPDPAAGEVLVRVHGAGLNRGDLAQRAGFYPAPPGAPADIPGLEFAGEVVAHGPGVDAPPIGARVFGVTGGGGQAELLAVPAGQCAPVPDGLDLVHAGGVPEVFMTAHDALVTIADGAAGETMFVPAVGSGVGTAAVQLGRVLGLTVVGSARTPDKLEAVTALGLDHALLAPRDLEPQAFAEQLVAAAGPIDVALDLVGGPYLTAEIRAAAPYGRIVLVGTMAGMRAEIEVPMMMAKWLRVVGTVLRPRTTEQKVAVTDAFVRDIVPRLADGSVRPVVARTFPLADASHAYDTLAAGEVVGKIVLACA